MQRITISLDETLGEALDRMTADRAYGSRSEAVRDLVREGLERWRIEQVHQELKGEVGFDHFEGRSWPGWQHHVTLALTCHALLVGERCVDAIDPAPPLR